MSRWYRAYAGTIKDDKLAEAAVVAGCSRSVVIATWHAILESAAETAGGGRFDTTSRRVAAALGEPASVIEAVFSAMQEIGLVSGSEIPAWKRRQYESDNSTERSRRHREATRNGNATLQGRCATPPYTETDTDTEKKKEEPAVLERASAPAPRKASPKARGSRIAPDWSPSPDDRQSARSEGMPESEIDRTAAKFRDFWTGKAGASGVKLDWAATWRNWVRADCEKRGWAPVATVATGPPGSVAPTGWRPGLPTDAELRAKYARLKNPEHDDEYAPTH
jgi:hypothetical protein